jgi:hypothetical protein
MERGLQGRVVMESGVKDGVQGGELKLSVAMALVCGQKDTKEIERRFVGFAERQSEGEREVESLQSRDSE